jgi:hypothetical protein
LVNSASKIIDSYHFRGIDWDLEHGMTRSRWRRATHDLKGRREVDPPIEIQSATWSTGGQLEWWIKDRQVWYGRVRGANGRQRWIRAVDLRPAKSE